MATRTLAAENAIEKGFWDSFFAICVTPDQDTPIAFQSKRFHVKYLVYALVVVVVLAALRCRSWRSCAPASCCAGS